MTTKFISLRRSEIVNLVCYMHGEAAFVTTAVKFESYSVGWQNGARTRVRSYRSMDDYHRYLNKLRALKVLDDQEYEHAWGMGLRLSLELGCMASRCEAKSMFPFVSEVDTTNLASCLKQDEVHESKLDPWMPLAQ